ncbi:hypothetical protein NUM_29320 [Actinocatenispora comari]|uniref:Uncharacterized protein n=1 Tax=Actinocatenispora comari TaxID=2807577 RepID=A0A8J4AFI3_9ACTN|nr:hypothetical protein NUM_29320 [Actinocatenispora comari]
MAAGYCDGRGSSGTSRGTRTGVAGRSCRLPRSRSGPDTRSIVRNFLHADHLLSGNEF